MKFTYFNDTKLPVTLRGQVGPGPEEWVYSVVEPQQVKTLEVFLKEGTNLFIKSWPNMLMVSFCEDNSHGDKNA
jgi:hypothetical protein